MSSGAEGPQSSMRIDGLVQNPFYAVQEPIAAEPTLWTYYNKPIILAAFGGLVLCAGIVLYLLGEFGVTGMPQGVGPVCLSVGVIFIVVALVLLPIIKDKMRRQGPKTRRTFNMEHV